MTINRQVMSPNRVTPRLRRTSDQSEVGNDSDREDDEHGSSLGDDDEGSSSQLSGTAKKATSLASSSSGESSSADSSDSESEHSSSEDADSSSNSGREKKRKRSRGKKRSSRKHSRKSTQDYSNLEVPKLTGADNYELWRTMLEPKFKVQKLWKIVVEHTVKKESWRSSKKRRFETRWLKAQETIAGSLGPRLAGRYRRLLVNCNPVSLFQEIEKEYNAGSAAKNDILIKSAKFTRKLARSERVDTYIDAVMKLQEDLVTLGFPLEDAELARLLLTDALEVFPELVAGRMKRTVFEVGRVRGRLLAREQEEKMRGTQVSHNPATSQNNNSAQGGEQILQVVDDRSTTRQHAGRGGITRGKRFSGHQSHRRSVRSGMDRRPYSICNQLGHWYRECPRNNKRGSYNGRQRDGYNGRSKSGGRGGHRGNDTTGPMELMVSWDSSPQMNTCSQIEWCLDSGAQVNICGDLSCFVEITTVSNGRVMRCANGSTANVNQKGSVELFVVNQRTGRREHRILSDVYYVPGAIANLISLDYMQSLGYFLSMAKDQSACFLDKSRISLQFKKVDGIYRIESVKPQEQQTEAVCNAILRSNSSQSLSLWHKRFAHASSETIRNMAKNQIVNGLQTNNTTFGDSDCLPCIKGKKVRMTYRERRNCAKKPLQKLQVDVCTVNELTLDGCNCFLLVVDEYSRYKWIFILKQKSEAKEHIIALVNRLHVKYRENKWRVEEIHSDQGGEFDNSVLQEFSSSEGISLTTTNGYTPQENGIVERANGIVLPKIRSLLHMTNLPESLWGEAALHVVHTMNVTASRVIQGITPHETLSGERPDVSWLRTWGSLCYFHIASGSRTRKKKLSSRMGVAILVGYSPATNGYKVIDLTSGGVSTHRDGNMVWAEDYTVGREYIEKLLANVYGHGDHQLPIRASIVPMQMQIEDVVKLDSVKESVFVPQSTQVISSSTPAEATTEANSTENNSQNSPIRQVVMQHSPRNTTVGEHDTVSRPHVSRFGRKRKRNSQFNDFELNLVTPCKSSKWLQELKNSCGSQARLHARDVPIPTTYKMAVESQYAEQWKAAMEEELASLRRHGVWIIVDRGSAGKSTVITNRWVFAVKKDEQGFVIRFKARLVIHGFKQRFGINYNETFAPVIRFDTIRAAVYFAVQRGWLVLQYDVKTAFLHGTLSEIVFMELPQGCGPPGNTRICRLVKSLYGLKTSSPCLEQNPASVSRGNWIYSSRK